jgi:mono/diheme cytochrome c family protein
MNALLPSWKNTLTPQDIADVVAFIRTLVVE